MACVSDHHCSLATTDGCKMSAASDGGAGAVSDATLWGQALESRGRSRAEMGILVLGDTAQKQKDGF